MLNFCDKLHYLNKYHYSLIDVFCRLVHLVIMLVDGESLQLMNLANHSMVMCSVQLYKNLRFVVAVTATSTWVMS